MPLTGHFLDPSRIFNNILRPVHQINAGVNEFGHRVANTGHQIQSTFSTLVDMLPVVILGGAALMVFNLVRD